MDIKVIQLNDLKKDPQGILSECCNQGSALVVELPDHRMVTIQSMEPDDPDDSLISDLLEHDPGFRALVEKSKASPRKPFTPNRRA